MKIEYEVTEREEFSEYHQGVLAQMLIEQNKVQGDPKSKIDRCRTVCIAKVESIAVAIGAIKVKTASDFEAHKANVPELCAEFEWELGYLYTKRENGGKGIASNITRLLLDCYGDGNLMASTEVSKNPAMVNILERKGFKSFGNPWKSKIHGNYLGLFLKFK